MGRRPEGPAHPRKGGIVQTVKRTVTEFQEDNLTDWAAALTYYSVLSIFPALIALVSIVGLVGDPKTVTNALTDVVSSIGPASAVDTFKGPIEDVTKSSGKAGIFAIVGIAAALWTASGYVGAFMRASNVIYEVEEGRLVRQAAPAPDAGDAGADPDAGAGAGGSGAHRARGRAGGLVARHRQHGGHHLGHREVAGARVVVLFMFALLYYSAPNVKLPGFKWVTPGSLLAIVVWLVASAGFAFYVANFGSYNKTYGALGGVIVFLVWLWLTNVAILLGAELNAEHERSRELEEGTRGAEREIQLEPRSEPKEKKRARTA